MKIGYVRVSDQDQSLDLQIDALQKAGCERLYSDHGVSGSKVQRKGLDELMASLKAGDALVVWKLDRLGRSTLHLITLLEDLRNRDVDFISITQGIDTRSSHGRLAFAQLAAFAEFEREQISERTKAGMQSAKDRGKHIGRPPALTAEQIADIRKRVIAGQSILDLAGEFGVSVRTLQRTLAQ